MHTQCPFCNTLFRVRAEQLRAARGQVRCSRCDQIFNALENLGESTSAEKEEWPESLLIDSGSPPPGEPESPEEEDFELEIGSGIQDEGHIELGDLLDISADPFPGRGEITTLEIGEIDHELGEIGSFAGDENHDLGEIASAMEELKPGLAEPGEETEADLEELDSDLADLEPELEQLVSQLDELDEESQPSILEEPAPYPEVAGLEGLEPGPEETAEPDLTDLTSQLDKIYQESGDIEPKPEAMEPELEDLVSELEELEAESEQILQAPEEPAPMEEEFGFESDNGTVPAAGDREETAPDLEEIELHAVEQGETTEAALAELASQLETFEPESEVFEPETETIPVAEEPVEPEPFETDVEAEMAQMAPAPVDMADITAAEEPAQPEAISLDDTLVEKPEKKGGRVFWTLGCIILILGAVAQASWLGRQQLLRYPEGRSLLEAVCQVAGCQLPARRAPKKIVVLNRSIVSHQEAENALQINITFVNRAKFDQPLPLLHIALYNRDKKPVVQRRFSPLEYLGRKPGEEELLKPEQAMEVEMVVEDPGSDVTGFKLDFF
jgi:predicted Zn finger-like uncharacterized protein